MAVLKDLIVHGPSRFLNGSHFNTINAESIGAEQGIFNKLIATTLDAKEATIDNLTAQNATVVGLLDVQGELHTNAWTNANIANIGGSFYISPTVEPTDGTTTISITRVSATSWTVSATGTFATDFIKSGTATSGVAWPANSLVLITGDVVVGDMVYPLGTLKGTLNAAVTATAASTSKTITITGVTDAQNNNAPSVLQELYELNNNANISNAAFKKGKISLYKLGSNPIGILMTSMGTNSNSLMDIYGGVSTNPSVRIGHLAGLPNINGSAPTGWGIYTDNGYFSGVIVSTSGKIANWSITNNSLQTGNYNTSGTMYFGSSGLSLSNTFSVTSAGALSCTSGYIANWKIESNDLVTGTWGADNSAMLCTGTSTSKSIGGSGSINGWVFTAGANFGVTKSGALYATSANITGAIVATSLDLTTNNVKIGSGSVNGLSTVATSGSYNDLSNKPTIPSLTGYIYQDGTVGSTPADGATGFVVSSTGALQASNAIIYGSLYASKGYIGGWQIGTDGNKSLHNGNANTSPTPAANVVILSKGITTTSVTGNLPAATYAITSGTNFGVTTNGALYASSGKIGGWTIDASKLYSGTHSAWNSAVTDGVYLGNDGIAGGNGGIWYLWKDGSAKIGQMTLSTAGVLTLGSISLNASGTATIGPWIVNSTSIYKGNATQGTAGTGNMYFGDNGLSISNTFTVSNAGVLNATGATLKNITLQDSNSKTRATVDTNGLKIFDASSNLKAQFGTDIDLYGGSSTTGAMPKININATNGITIAYSNTNKAVIDSNGMKVYKDDASNSVAQFGNTTRIGSESDMHFLATGSRVGAFNGTNTLFDFNSAGTSITDTVLKILFIGRVMDFPIGESNKKTVVLSGTIANSSTLTVYIDGTSATTFTKGTSATKTINSIIKITYDGNATMSYYATDLSGEDQNSRLRLHVVYSTTSEAATYVIGSGLASGTYSIAFNHNTIASSEYQSVFGKNNEEDTANKYSIIVGKGSSGTNRSNALTVDWSGNVNITGNISTGHTPSAGQIGEIRKDEPSAVSTQSGKYYKIAEVTLTPGVWVYTTTAEFAANTSGYRRAYTTTTSFTNGTTTAPTVVAKALVTNVAQAGGQVTHTHDAMIFTVTTDTPYRLVAYQNGGNLSVTGRIYAVRIA